VRIPRSKHSFAAGETFIFLVLLLHGAQAASMAAAGEALVGSWRTSKRWTSRIASPAMVIVAMFIAGSLLEAGLGALRARGWYSEGVLMSAAMLFSIGYFVLNTLLATLVIHLKGNQPMVLRELLSNFGWVALAYAGSASVAWFDGAQSERRADGSGAHRRHAADHAVFFRQQEADEAMRPQPCRGGWREVRRPRCTCMMEHEQRFHAPSRTHDRRGAGCGGEIRQVNRADRVARRRRTRWSAGASHRCSTNPMPAPSRRCSLACTAARLTPSTPNCAAVTATVVTSGWRWTAASSTSPAARLPA
jgi:hypothetical protein